MNEKIDTFLKTWCPEKIRDYLHQMEPYCGPYAEEYLSLTFYEQMRLLGRAENISADDKLFLIVPEGYGSTENYRQLLNNISPVPVDFVTPMESKIDYFTYDTTRKNISLKNNDHVKNRECKIREICTRYPLEILLEAVIQYDSEEFQLIRNENTFYTEEDYNVSVLKEFYTKDELRTQLEKYSNGFYCKDVLDYATCNELQRAIDEYDQKDYETEY